MKTITIFKSFFFLSLIMSVSCKNNEEIAVDTTAEGKHLMQISKDWSDAAVSRDIEKTLAYWSDDAILISAGQPTLKGKDDIRKMVEGSINDPNFSISWEPISAEISESGDMGYLMEKSQITMTDSTGTANVMHFEGVTIWKKQADGSWKNVVDIMSPTN